MLSAALLAASALSSGAQAAQRDICENMSGEQLRRCIEASSREAPKPAASALAPAAPRPSGPAQAVTPAPNPPSVAQAAEPKELQRRDCTKVPQPDQALCVHRNTALLECSVRSKYPDQDKCLADLMSRAPNPAIADCSKLVKPQQPLCFKRNKAYAACKGDKLGYFACLDKQLASAK
jgi:hypothetical protein